MTKIEAITKLINEECDEIVFGRSVFILVGDKVINKTSKKALEMNDLFGVEWEAAVIKKWFEEYNGSYIWCTITGEEGGEVFALVAVDKNGVAKEYGTNFICDDPVPMSRADVMQYVFNAAAMRDKTNDVVDTAQANAVQAVASSSEELTTDLATVAEPEQVVEAVQVHALYDAEEDIDDADILFAPLGKSQMQSSENTAEAKEEHIVKPVFAPAPDGIPVGIVKYRKHFEDLGLPPEAWHGFWQDQDLNSSNIEEYMENSARSHKDDIDDYLLSIGAM